MRGFITQTSVHVGRPCANFASRTCSDSGAQQPFRRTSSNCRASARQPDGADGEAAFNLPGNSPIDIEWRQRRWGKLWKSLAEQDRNWAVHSYTEGDELGSLASASEDSLDFGSPSPGSPPTSLAHAPWLSACSPCPGQPSVPLGKRTVYVILFGVGSSDTEGIYSVRVITREEGLPQDTIIAFSDKEDATRYAGLLEASMEYTPTVIGIEPSELLDFCTDSNYSYHVEEHGSLLIPPDYYVGMTDWERTVRLREGKWSVSESECVNPHEQLPGPSVHRDSQQQPLVGNNANFYPLSESDSAYLLEQQRARLERLAAQD